MLFVPPPCLRTLRLTSIAVVLTATLAAGAVRAEDTPTPSDAVALEDLGLTLSGIAEYTEGKFGTRRTTRILYVPFAVDWDATDRLDFKLTVPYIWEHGQDILATLGGGAVRAPRRITVRERRGGAQRVRTEDGLGDVLLEGNYVLLEEEDFLPELTAFVQIKFPTANSSRGLGTGEFDEEPGVTLTKRLGERWTTSLDLSYAFIGSPPRTHLDNSFAWSVGVSYRVLSSLRLSTNLEGATAVARGEQDPLDLRFAADYKLTKIFEITAGGLVGLSDGSPDFGVLAGIRLRL